MPGNIWDPNLRGLYSAEPLKIGLNKLEDKYMANEGKCIPTTYHISLRQIDPFALIKLRRDGECEFTIDEAFLNLQFPGNYMRRIHSLSVTIPCVTGPHTTLGGILVQQKSKIRVKTDDGADSYREISLPITQSIAISTGREESGLHNPAMYTDKYRPFEDTEARGLQRILGCDYDCV
jgi:hypothetical protein